jgi:alpha-L-arabinofuranosidase
VAIKAKYPEMTVVMSMYWSGLNWGAIRRAGENAIDIVDQHAYRPSGWARSNFEYFDKYERNAWKVYMGEYAHHHGGGDWSAAMDDSVFLMMMERSGDVVTMASYYNQPVRAEIQLDGAASVAAAGQHLVIRSGQPTDENSLENPRRIVPQEQPLSNCALRFPVTLPPLSVNVLRIGANAQ